MCLAVPGKIVSVEDDAITGRVGKVSFDGILKQVHLGFVPDAEVNSYVLVHVGVAISQVDEEEAKITMEYLRELGDFDGIDELEERAEQ